MKTMGRKPAKRRTKFGRELTELRERLGLSQLEAAAKIGVHLNSWSSWERGTELPSKSHQILIKLLEKGTI